MWSATKSLSEESSNNLVEMFHQYYPCMDANPTLQRKVEAITQELASRDFGTNCNLLSYLERFLATAKEAGNMPSIAIHLQMITYYKKTVLANH